MASTAGEEEDVKPDLNDILWCGACEQIFFNLDDFVAHKNDNCHPPLSRKETKEVLKSVGLFALKTAVISGAVIGGISIAVPALGFTAGGVAARSAAAAYQSAVLGGTIVSGSAFAVLQSIGATGLAASTQGGIVAASAAVAGGYSWVKKKLKKK